MQDTHTPISIRTGHAPGRARRALSGADRRAQSHPAPAGRPRSCKPRARTGRYARGKRRSAPVAGRARRLVCRVLDRPQHAGRPGRRLSGSAGTSGLDRTSRRFLVGTFPSRPADPGADPPGRTSPPRAAGCWRRWRPRWTCWTKPRTATTRCISTAWRCSTKTRWASEWWFWRRRWACRWRWRRR